MRPDDQSLTVAARIDPLRLDRERVSSLASPACTYRGFIVKPYNLRMGKRATLQRALPMRSVRSKGRVIGGATG